MDNVINIEERIALKELQNSLEDLRERNLRAKAEERYKAKKQEKIIVILEALLMLIGGVFVFMCGVVFGVSVL